MVMHHFELGPDGGDPEQFVRAMTPTQLIGAIHQVISLLSITGPAREAASFSATIDGIVAEEAGWLERATGNASDPKAIIEHVAGNLGEGLDMENIPDSGEFTDGARLNMRNALFFCWTALPEARRTRPEAERIVRLAISRQFALMEDIRKELSGG